MWRRRRDRRVAHHHRRPGEYVVGAVVPKRCVRSEFILELPHGLSRTYVFFFDLDWLYSYTITSNLASFCCANCNGPVFCTELVNAATGILFVYSDDGTAFDFAVMEAIRIDEYEDDIWSGYEDMIDVVHARSVHRFALAWLAGADGGCDVMNWSAVSE